MLDRPVIGVLSDTHAHYDPKLDEVSERLAAIEARLDALSQGHEDHARES